jgi:hypothetical protein
MINALVGSLFDDRLRASSHKFLWIGMAMIVTGIAAMLTSRALETVTERFIDG